MSFIGSNPLRPDAKGRHEATGPGARSEAIFLGEASKLKDVSPAEETPTLSGDVRPFGQTGPTPPEKCTNVVAAGAKWKGTLTVEDSVRVEGTFSGEIQTKGTVHVADGAQVDAKVRAAFVVVSGSFQGEIRCDQKVELLPRSRVNAEVFTKVLSVHEGAKLDGRVQMTGSLEGEGRTGRASRAAADEELTAAAATRRNGEE